MRTCVTTIGLLLAALVGITATQSWAEETKPAAEKATTTSPAYACPMHPQIQATFPGTCPLCKMALKAKTGGEAPPAAPLSSEGHAHAAMPTNGMDMGGMGMMNCPSCRMGMGGMSAAPAAPAGVIKAAPSGYRTVGGRRCGC